MAQVQQAAQLRDNVREKTDHFWDWTQFMEKWKQCLNSNTKARKYLIVSQNYITYGVIIVTKLCVNVWHHLQMQSAICKCVHKIVNMYSGLKCAHTCKCVIQPADVKVELYVETNVDTCTSTDGRKVGAF